MKAISQGIYECPVDGFRSSWKKFTEKIPNWKFSHSINLSKNGGDHTIRSIVCAKNRLYVVCGNAGGVFCVEKDSISNTLPINIRKQKFYDMALSPEGSIILSDQDEGKVYMIGVDLRLTTFDNHGTIKPRTALDFDDKGDIYLGESDAFSARITMLDQDGAQFKQFILDIKEVIKDIRRCSTSAISIGFIGRNLYSIYILDRNCDMIFRFKINGNYMCKIPYEENPKWKPHYIVRPRFASWFAVTCKRNKEVIIFDGSENNERSRFKLNGFIPSALAFDSKENMYVGDLEAPKVYVYKASSQPSHERKFPNSSAKEKFD